MDNPAGNQVKPAEAEPAPMPLKEEPREPPPTSPPKATEDELDAALNGQEPTVKNLILAAIGVMKVSPLLLMTGLHRS